MIWRFTEQWHIYMWVKLDLFGSGKIVTDFKRPETRHRRDFIEMNLWSDKKVLKFLSWLSTITTVEQCFMWLWVESLVFHGFETS